MVFKSAFEIRETYRSLLDAFLETSRKFEALVSKIDRKEIFVLYFSNPEGYSYTCRLMDEIKASEPNRVILRNSIVNYICSDRDNDDTDHGYANYFVELIDKWSAVVGEYLDIFESFKQGVSISNEIRDTKGFAALLASLEESYSNSETTLSVWRRNIAASISELDFIHDINDFVESQS